MSSPQPQPTALAAAAAHARGLLSSDSNSVRERRLRDCATAACATAVRGGPSRRAQRATNCNTMPEQPLSATPRLRLRRRAVDACALPARYAWLGGRGAGAARCTIRSRVVPLPRDLVAYLAQHGVVLPRAPGALRPRDPSSARPAARVQSARLQLSPRRAQPPRADEAPFKD